MLKKEFRNFTQREVDLTYKKGITCFGKYCLLKFLAKPQTKKTLVVVSTKCSKNAVNRNHLRRQFYEILQKNWENVPNGLLLFSCKPKCEKLSITEISTDLTFILKKCLLNKNQK